MLALMAALVEMACNRLTTGVSHSINLGFPSLNSSKARDCSRNTARTESGESHRSMAMASGWLQRSFPVRLVYAAKAASKRASKLEEEVVLGAEDIAILGILNVVRGRWLKTRSD